MSTSHHHSSRGDRRPWGAISAMRLENKWSVVKLAQERRGRFSVLHLKNVLAKLKALIQTQMPTFEETMTRQRATSGPGL